MTSIKSMKSLKSLKCLKTVSKLQLVVGAISVLMLTGAWTIAEAAKPAVSGLGSEIGGSNWQHRIFEHVERRLFKIVDATDAQKEKLSAIFSNTFEQNAEIRQELTSKVLAVSHSYADDSVSNEQIKQQLTEINDLRGKLRTKRVDALLEARSILSVQQRKTLASRINERLTD